ncbi:MAG: dihydrofolate reductase family protein [Gemmatales bacterium]
MKRICYSVAMSLDGYVAGPNGEADWIVMDPEMDFMALMSRFDTVLMGRLTYEAAQKQGNGGAMPGVTSVVVSKTLRPEEHPDVTIVGDDVVNALTKMKASKGKDIWLFGGGNLFRSLLGLGLVDSIEVAVIPVLLGGGVPLLPTGAKRTTLKLENSKQYKKTGTMSLEYSVKKK